MQRGTTWAMMLCTIIAVVAVSDHAHAQLVVGKAEIAVSDVHYVVVREGTRSVFYLLVAVDDAAKGDFSVVIPGASKKKARAASPSERALITQLDDLTAPRLVEYWEQDPCEFHTGGPDDGVAERDVAPDTQPEPPAKAGGAPELATHAGAAALKAALEGRGHPLGDADLSAYNGNWLVVSAAADDNTVAVRWEMEGDALSVPVRLLTNQAKSAPQVVIDVIGGRDRYEAKNRTNLAAPTNTNVKLAVKGSTDAFHAAMLEQLFATRPDAVVTDYVWSATSCGPCTGPPLTAAGLVSLGVGSGAKNVHEVMIFTDGKIAKRPDGPPALRSALLGCYGKALAADSAAGEVTVEVAVEAGKVTTAKTSTSNDAPDALQKCAESSVKATTFDGTGSAGKVRVQFHPMSRKYVADVVVTRLRTRVNAKTKLDVALRAGAPIAGGAEVGPTGGPKVGAYASPKANNFQARYAVRHKWAGKEPSCLNPATGKWGAPPEGVTPKPAGKALTEVEVAELVDGDLPGADALTMRFPPRKPAPKPNPPSPAASHMPSTAPSASAAPIEQSKPPREPDPNKRWIGILALGVCVAALYLAQRAQT